MNRYSRTAASTVISMVLAFSHMSHAEQSTLQDGYLTVPSIAVEEFGAFEMVFRLDIDEEFRFVLVDSTDAAQSVGNSGKFDPAARTIEVNEIVLANGESYTAQLRLVSASPEMVFKLADAASLNPVSEDAAASEHSDEENSAPRYQDFIDAVTRLQSDSWLVEQSAEPADEDFCFGTDAYISWR